MNIGVVILASILGGCASDLQTKTVEPSTSVSPNLEEEELTEEEQIELIRIRFCEYSGNFGDICAKNRPN